MQIPKVAFEPALKNQPSISPSDLKTFALPFLADIATDICGPINQRLSNSNQLRFGTHGSLLIDVRATSAGKWYNFETCEGGGIFDLIMSRQGCDFQSAYEWLLWRVGFGDSTRQSVDFLRKNQERSSSAGAQEADYPVRQEKKLLRAQAIWESAIRPGGTIVEKYLGGRACWLNSLSDGNAIRFNPACPMDDGACYPAMVAAMTDAETGLFTGIHRTHLLPDGSGKGARAKRMLGRAKGSVIRLFGSGGRTCFAEGIETTLTASLIEEYESAVCVCSMGNFFVCSAVPGTTEAHVFSDNASHVPMHGASNPLHAACFYAARCEAARQHIRVIAPPAEYSDMNDWAWQKPMGRS